MYYFNIIGTIVGTTVCLMLIYITRAQQTRSDFNRLVSYMASCELMMFIVFFNANLFFDYPNELETITSVVYYTYSIQIFFLSCSYIISSIISYMLYNVISSQTVVRIDDYKYPLLCLVIAPNAVWWCVSVAALYTKGLVAAYHIVFYSYYIILATLVFNIISYIGCLLKVRKMKFVGSSTSPQANAILALVDRYKWYPIIQVLAR